MRYSAFATDFDGTLANDGFVSSQTIFALEKLRNSGRKLILVTGRELDQLKEVFPKYNIFDSIVAENGALYYEPSTNTSKLLCEPPPEKFIYELKRRNIYPLSFGDIIIATWKPNELIALEVIRDMGIEMQVIFNKDAVMILPAGVNKASGLKYVLDDMNISLHNTIGIGDAENDYSFLTICEFSAVVANALPALKEKADYITNSNHGEGVEELIEMILKDDLLEIEKTVTRHNIPLGTKHDNTEYFIKPARTTIMVAGKSGGGKSTFATALIEQFVEKGYQICIIDPEGDYNEFRDTIVEGTSNQPPVIENVMKTLDKQVQNCIVNLLALNPVNRPVFFNELLPKLAEIKLKTGRPHWLIIDEAHHLMPPTWESPLSLSFENLEGLMLLTVNPDHIYNRVLYSVTTLAAIGNEPAGIIENYCEMVGIEKPELNNVNPFGDEIVVWNRTLDALPEVINPIKPEFKQQRHKLKYAEGNVGDDTSFYFRGPEGKLNLKVQNLMLFIQIAEGIDNETWLYHLGRGDYSNWFREVIKDDELALETEEVERNNDNNPEESKSQIKEKILSKYTLPD